ncbi:MAG: ornithine carbamoyltransferase [Phycisphaerales bacterium]|nr:ornithine carbamoyltransferase [Phycisphaerales bacterium]
MQSDMPDILRNMRHFLSMRDYEAPVIEALIDFGVKRKQLFKSGRLKQVLQGKILAMLFQKSSLRTRLGFEAAMIQLGGHAINLEDHQVGLANREDVKDIARVISSMCDGLMARVYAHQSLIELASVSTIPVINGLSDWSHPCQALADMMTIREHFGEFKDLKLAFIGDGNNVARSLCNASALLGVSFAIASPSGYALDAGVLEHARSVANQTKASVLVTDQPAEAAAAADIIYTDVWTSMGQETEQADREKAFAGFQVNAELMKRAKPHAVIMHCLPAHRQQEITHDVLDGPQSLVFQQAENRLHSQRALLEVLLGQ